MDVPAPSESAANCATKASLAGDRALLGGKLVGRCLAVPAPDRTVEKDLPANHLSRAVHQQVEESRKEDQVGIRVASAWLTGSRRL